MALYNIGLSFLPINETKKAERNKILSAEARRILSILADYPINCIDDVIAIEENSRPFFKNSDMDFSISHSGAAVAVSLVQNESIHGAKIRTGCDIQLIQPRKNLSNIIEDNFCAAEREYIFSQGETQFDYVRFFQIWTLKECLLKLRGLSVFDMPKVPSFISCDAIHSPRDASGRHLFSFNINDHVYSSSPLSFYLYELEYAGERYMLATAIEGGSDKRPDIHPEIRMFSNPSIAALLKEMVLLTKP